MILVCDFSFFSHRGIIVYNNIRMRITRMASDHARSKAHINDTW